MLAAQSIPLPRSDESAKGFCPYVKVELHVEEPGGHHLGAAAAATARESGREKEGEYKERTRTLRGCDPDFKGEALAFGAIPGVVEELAFVRFIVRDDELFKDDLAAWACVRLDRLRQGYRFVHLLDALGQETDGVLLVKVAKKLY